MFPSSSLDFSYLTEIKKIELYVFVDQGCIFFLESSKFKGFASLEFLLVLFFFFNQRFGFYHVYFKEIFVFGENFFKYCLKLYSELLFASTWLMMVFSR